MSFKLARTEDRDTGLVALPDNYRFKITKNRFMGDDWLYLKIQYRGVLGNWYTVDVADYRDYRSDLDQSYELASRVFNAAQHKLDRKRRDAEWKADKPNRQARDAKRIAEAHAKIGVYPPRRIGDVK